MNAVDPMKQDEEEEGGEMGIFYTPSKIMKLMPFILIINGTSKQHKRMPHKALNQSLKVLGRY